MTDTRRWIGAIRGVDPPALWDEVERRAKDVPPDPSPRRSSRLLPATIVVVSVAVVGGAIYALGGLDSDRTPTPGASSPTVVSRSSSLSPDVVPVPDVIGASDQGAMRALDRLGLRPLVRYRSGSRVDRWDVVSQDPAPGSNVDVGTTVGLVVATVITPLPPGASDALACPPDERVAFGGPRLQLLPGGSAAITANTLGIEAGDEVVQATVEHHWSGLWHVIRDGAVIAVVDFDSLDGEACRGSGVAGA